MNKWVEYLSRSKSDGKAKRSWSDLFGDVSKVGQAVDKPMRSV
jgi:hypothetical protein